MRRRRPVVDLRLAARPVPLLAARLMVRIGSRACLVVGAAVLVVGAVPRVFAAGSLAMIAASAAVASIGTAIAFCALPALVLDSTPAPRSAAANGLNALARSTGTAIASATLGALLGVGAGGMVGFFVVGAAASVGALLSVMLVPRAPARYRPTLPPPEALAV